MIICLTSHDAYSIHQPIQQTRPSFRLSFPTSAIQPNRLNHRQTAKMHFCKPFHLFALIDSECTVPTDVPSWLVSCQGNQVYPLPQLLRTNAHRSMSSSTHSGISEFQFSTEENSNTPPPSSLFKQWFWPKIFPGRRVGYDFGLHVPFSVLCTPRVTISPFGSRPRHRSCTPKERVRPYDVQTINRRDRRKTL